jgi:TolA-binding protein
MRSLVFIFSVIVLFSCSSVIADQDKKENDLDNKNVVAKDDDFAAIMLRSQKTGLFASSAVKKADKAVVSKIEVTVQKIDKLEDKIENLTKTNEELQVKANSFIIEPYIIEPLIDSTVSKKNNQ